ncbi:MAG: hypothetical protein CVV27_11500 [Candidatus Melainabacteria bacterium HGW-Melainabacteria-1]|nr:MAG: hypothetical protein CVV27_11500 [Candidatus Melainabacteria bacterium HGW-Melainabacteria-1]
MMDNPNILVVDDISPNIRLVVGLLSPEGYDVSFANSGKKGLELVMANDFDLILLDIMMPDLDGISVCREIKRHPDKRDIPVIFLTGKTDEISISEAFEAGGVDYLHKPVNPVELVARVKTHLELKRARDIIQQSNQELNLALRLKNQFLGMASHDLKGPLGAVQGYVNLISRDEESQLSPRAHKGLEAMANLSTRMLEIVNTFLDKAALELGRIELKPRYINLVETIRPLLESFREQASAKGQTLRLETVDEIWLHADKHRLSQIVDNLLSNAVKYSPLQSPIDVALQDHKEHIEIRITDQGPGFSPADKNLLYGYFQRLSARPTANESSTGIGLALTRQIVELHGGKIELFSEQGEGASFVVSLPKNQSGSQA